MSALLLASAAVGFLLPLALAKLNRVAWSPRVKSAFAFIACLLASLLTTVASGDMSFADWAAAAAVVFGAAQASYRGLWHPTGIAPAIEKSGS